MATWKDPKTTYTAENQVVPEIFNTLGENEIYLNEKKIETQDVQEGAITSTEASTRENITTGEKIKTIVSKIRKWFADLRTLAFRDTVDSEHIESAAITMGKIQSNAVTSGKLATGAVTTAKLGDGAVTEAKLATSAVTNSRLADGAVTTSKLGDSAVTNEKINSVDASKVDGLATVATSGSYNDLTNKPSFSSGVDLSYSTYNLDKTYNIPATGLYLAFFRFTNAAGYPSVASLGTFSNRVNQVNASCSSVSTIYDGAYKHVQLRCIYIGATQLKYELYISDDTKTMPYKKWDNPNGGSYSLIMYKIGNYGAI